MRQLWRSFELEEKQIQLSNCSSALVLEEIWKLNNGQQIEMLTVLWVWRTTQNKISQGEGVFILDVEVVFLIRNLVANFKKCLKLEVRQSTKPSCPI